MGSHQPNAPQRFKALSTLRALYIKSLHSFPRSLTNNASSAISNFSVAMDQEAQANPAPSFLLDLPDELFLLIANYLGIEGMQNFRLSCHRLELATYDHFAKQYFSRREAALNNGSLNVLEAISNHSKLRTKVKHLRLAGLQKCRVDRIERAELELLNFITSRYHTLVRILRNLPNLEKITILYCQEHPKCEPYDCESDSTFARVVAAIEAADCKIRKLACEIPLSPLSFLMPCGEKTLSNSSLSSIFSLDIFLLEGPADYDLDEVFSANRLGRYFVYHLTHIESLSLGLKGNSGSFGTVFIEWLSDWQKYYQSDRRPPNDLPRPFDPSSVPTLAQAPRLSHLKKLALKDGACLGGAIFNLIVLCNQLSKCELHEVQLSLLPLYDDVEPGPDHATWRDLLSLLAVNLHKPHRIVDFMISDLSEEDAEGGVRHVVFGDKLSCHYVSSSRTSTSPSVSEASSNKDMTHFEFSDWLSEMAKIITYV